MANKKNVPGLPPQYLKDQVAEDQQDRRLEDRLLEAVEEKKKKESLPQEMKEGDAPAISITPLPPVDPVPPLPVSDPVAVQPAVQPPFVPAAAPGSQVPPFPALKKKSNRGDDAARGVRLPNICVPVEPVYADRWKFLVMSSGKPGTDVFRLLLCGAWDMIGGELVKRETDNM